MRIMLEVIDIKLYLSSLYSFYVTNVPSHGWCVQNRCSIFGVASSTELWAAQPSLGSGLGSGA